MESNETKSNNKSKSPMMEKNKEQTLDTSDLLIENALLASCYVDEQKVFNAWLDSYSETKT